MNSIPASALVSVIPSVLSAGGTPLSMNGLFVTEDTSIPIGTVQAFANLTSVQNWFGPTTNQATLAANYFNGYTGAGQLPGLLYFAQYNTVSVAGYLRGGSIAALTLAQIQALSGTITVVIDGTSHTSASINLSAATSFSDAASIIQTGLQSGTPSTTATVTYDALRQAFVITSSTTGATSAVAFPTDTSLSPSLYLTKATGAVTSPGAAASTPGATMDAVVEANRNWASFTTDFLPTSSDMLAFAAWSNAQSGSPYVYVGYDNSSAPTTGAAPTSFGAEVATYNGVCPIWNPSGQVAAFICGSIASIDFTAQGGRITFAFKGQSGLTADVTSQTVADNLTANGYNFYADYATATNQFVNFQTGLVSGTWKWLDSFVDQIYFSALFQTTLLTFLTQIGAVPYNHTGYSQIAEALSSPIKQMGAFGAFVTGVTLSGTQIAAIKAAVGTDVSASLYSNGYYLYIADPGPTARANRQTPIIKFYYTDGGAVQQIVLDSINVQ